VGVLTVDSIVKQSTVGIGDVVLSYNKKTQLGNNLLQLNGSVLDEKKYPLLTSVLGKKEQLSEISTLTSSQATGVTQSDDGEHCYLAVDSDLYKYTRSLDSYILINNGIGSDSGEVVCSANGQHVVYCSGIGSSQVANCKAYIYTSNDYGQTFTLTRVLPLQSYSPGFSFATLFMSRNGQNVVALANDAYGARVCVSTNYAIDWAVYDRPPELKHAHESFFVSATEDLSKIWVKSYLSHGDTSYIVESTDNGNTWLASTGLTDGIDMVNIDPYDNNSLVAYRYNSISKFIITKDGGATWGKIAVPDGVVGIRLAVLDRGALFIYAIVNATDYRFYTSIDDGVTWAENSLPSNIWRLAIKPIRVDGTCFYFIHNDTLYTTTYSSLCKLPIGNLLSERIVADQVVI
jgi:hypothetical protein